MLRILYDISLSIDGRTPVYAGDPQVELEPLFTLEADGVNVTALRHATTHTGTHVDLPRHVIAGGASLDAVPPERFCGRARVIAIRDPLAITAAELAGHAIGADEIVLFRTRNSEERLLERPAFQPGYVYLAPDAAAYLVQRQVRLVGIDYLSVDPPDDPALPAHHILLGAGVFILEGALLSAVPSGLYELLCLPLRISGADGAPVRAVLAEWAPAGVRD
jgi:arylformamidase